MGLVKKGTASDPTYLEPRVSQLESTTAALNTATSKANSQTQLLQQGVQVVNASINSGLDVEVQGRTLVSMGSSILDPLKNYVLTAKHTKLKWADASTVQGVAKFVGKQEKPALIRIATFLNKVSASTVENPHIMKYLYSSTLESPTTGGFSEGSTTYYNQTSKLDGTSFLASKLQNGQYAEHLFSFDIIQEIERQLGRIPKATLAEKVQWCKDNIKTLTANWYGYGSGPAGNKAYLTAYFTVWNNSFVPSHANNGVSKLSYLLNSGNGIASYIQSDGFAHFLAYADASGTIANPTVAPTLTASGSGSGLAAGTYYVVYTWANASGETLVSPESSITITAGQNIGVTVPALPFGASNASIFISQATGTETLQGTTTNGSFTQSAALASGRAPFGTNQATVASTINTDYVELEIELNQTAVLHDPLVPLYEVDATEYANILVSWDETTVLNRYPKVQGVQHLQNPYVIAEGDNILPPFSEWTLHATATMNNSYSLALNPTTSGLISYVDVPIIPGQTYSGGINDGVVVANLYFKLETFDANGNKIATRKDSSAPTYTYTAVSGETKLRVTVYGVVAGSFNVNNPMLTLGTTAKPFVPRNPSYLFATAKLGQIGTVKDVLYKQDGQWNVRKSVEKDVALDGSLAWLFLADAAGFKTFTTVNPSNAIASTTNLVVTKYNGLKLNSKTGIGSNDETYFGSSSQAVTVADADTGFGETYTPTAQEISAYFNGWQAKTVDGTGKPTAWKSLGDGTDAPTQTLAYVSANKAPNFTPYKLSYVLATPAVQPAAVEGDIAVNGLTQVEVGSGVIVREKIVPFLITEASGDFYQINKTGYAGSYSKQKLSKFISIFKNGINDTSKWNINTTFAGNGSYRAYVPKVDYDASAEYTVTYLLLDRHLFTNNGIDLKATYSNSIRSALDDLVAKQSDNTTALSVNIQAIAELYKRVKALGG